MSKKDLFLLCTITAEHISEAVKIRESLISSANAKKGYDAYELYNMNIGFYLSDEESLISNKYIPYYDSKTVAMYNDLDQIILDYIYKGTDYKLSIDKARDILSCLSGYDFIFKLKGNKFYLVPHDTISARGELLIAEVASIANAYLADIDFNDSKYDEFNDSFNKLINSIEKISVNSVSVIDMSSSVDDMEWRIDILDTKWKLYSHVPKVKGSSTSNGGFVYSCGLDVFKKYILKNTTNYSNTVLSITVLASDVDTYEDYILDRLDIYRKMYCVTLMPNTDMSFDINYMTAKNLYDICLEVMPNIHPVYNIIYSGLEENDVICGFDMID